jgi:carbon-monoxide dehydrogenase small subunit
MINQIAVRLTVNGKPVQVNVAPGETLLTLLREDLGLTGTKDGCGEGECGACTVLLDGEAVNACLVLAAQANGHEVLTIEGLAVQGELHPVQRAFVEIGAVQCGFCTPGAVLSAVALLARDPDPNEREVRQALSGNLCRCTGYAKMVQAVRHAAKEMANG